MMNGTALKRKADPQVNGIQPPSKRPSLGEDAPRAKAKPVLQEAVPTVETGAPADVKMEDDEEDPLDAFMSGLGQSVPKTNFKKQKQGQTEALLGEDQEAGGLTAIGENADDILAITSKVKKKSKGIPKVDHDKVQYEPFRKKFYTAPGELAEMSEEDVADLRLELDGIKVHGLDVPAPVSDWAQCGLPIQFMEVIQGLKFAKPTPVQAQAIPVVMSGRDCIAVASTGSGKTVAFLLPMFRAIKDQRPLQSMDGPIGLIITPTRELSLQIFTECKPWLKKLNLRAVAAYGGAPISQQIADLKRGAEIVIATPGRLIDLLAANGGRVLSLKRVTYLVLDEADRSFDAGFQPQVSKILELTRPDRQTVMTSATFPKSMEALARKALNTPCEIQVGGRSVVGESIKQSVEVLSEENKFHRLLQLLGELHEQDEDAASLAFVETHERAEDLMQKIMRAAYPCQSLHGGKDQYDRDSVISDFKAGIFPVLVATSVAARGLDVKNLKLVVNYDSPNHLEDYVHRCGRTGRAGNTGKANTFVREDQDRFAPFLIKALQQSGQEVPQALQELSNTFREKVKAGKEKVAGSGFGGKGLERLDQDRDTARNRERKVYKTGDEVEEEEDKEDEAPKIEIKATNDPAPAPAPAVPAPQPQQLIGVPEGIDLDGPVQVHRYETAAPAAGGKSKDRMAGVSAAVEAINARLRKSGDIRGNAPIDNKGPDAGEYHATLEINDFPQKARWAVTNRTNVAKILEATGVSITSKGNFYAKGSIPEAGQPPKLSLLVEANTSVAVENAMRELMRLLKEGTQAAMDSEARAPASGRYTVV